MAIINYESKMRKKKQLKNKTHIIGYYYNFTFINLVKTANERI